MIDVGVIVFPGSTCERDLLQVLSILPGVRALAVPHRLPQLPPLDAVALPGGFSHGDYLRPGAIARFAPVMEAVTGFARSGGPVLGICNGFQILTEAGLLPGALLPNRRGRFVCRQVRVQVQGMPTPLTIGLARDRPLRLPVAHDAGRYHLAAEELVRLEAEGRVVLRYDDGSGCHCREEANPNGSLHGVAGVCSPPGNVVGLMPHPERAALAGQPWGTEGLALLGSLLRWCRR